MKNLMVYINPRKDFDAETHKLVKIQIDNMLSLGWKLDDIMIVTNFPYKYGKVRAMVVGDEHYFSKCPTVAKVSVIYWLLKNGYLKELTWFHDFDNYQLVPFDPPDIGDAELGVSDYGRMPLWSTGSMFFKPTATQLFRTLSKVCYKIRTDEETALMKITNKNIDGLRDKVKKINITYNFQWFNFRKVYHMVEKPIKATHFHIAPDQLDFFFYGKNRAGVSLVPKRLIRIFRSHGIK